MVLFEMLTGRPCSAGDTITDILAAAFRAEPEAVPTTLDVIFNWFGIPKRKMAR